ncbi:MAG: hypothetical protein WAX07_03645 [Candidatus Altiarchaeia archaeon]
MTQDFSSSAIVMPPAGYISLHPSVPFDSIPVSTSGKCGNDMAGPYPMARGEYVKERTMRL